MFDHIRVLSLVQTSIAEPKLFIFCFTFVPLSLMLAPPPAFFDTLKAVDPDPHGSELKNAARIRMERCGSGLFLGKKNYKKFQ